MDEIVSTVNYEGDVYIFTKRGFVYKMFKDFSGQISFQLLHEVRLRQ